MAEDGSESDDAAGGGSPEGADGQRVGRGGGRTESGDRPRPEGDAPVGSLGGDADAATAALRDRLAGRHWVADTVRSGDVVGVEVDGVPDLRSVYEAVARTGATGAVVVQGDDQEWRVDHDRGEVLGVERTGGAYTVRRRSRAEVIAEAVAAVGARTFQAALITAVASLLVAVPFDLLQLGLAAAAGLTLSIAGHLLFRTAPGITSGPRAATPGESVDGFEELPDPVRAAMVAVDDAKSARNLEALSLSVDGGTLPTLAGFGLLAYLWALAYLNFGAPGLFGAALLFSALGARQVRVLSLIDDLEPIEDPTVDRIVESIREDAGDERPPPTVLGLGPADDPVHETAAVAVPERGQIVLPRADVARLHEDELAAIVAHEYEHYRSHRPATRYVVALGTLYVPAVVASLVPIPSTVAVGPVAVPEAAAVGVAVFLFMVAVGVAMSGLSRRTEREADDFAAEAVSPLALALALNRLTDRHVLAAGDGPLVGGMAGELYGSHPFPHRRVETLLDRAREEGDPDPVPGRLSTGDPDDRPADDPESG